MYPFVVLRHGSSGRNGWMEGNGPRGDIIWANTQKEAYQIARHQHWPHSVSVQHLLECCRFHHRLMDVLDNDGEDWKDNVTSN